MNGCVRFSIYKIAVKLFHFKTCWDGKYLEIDSLEMALAD
jgi:hypothetical protein